MTAPNGGCLILFKVGVHDAAAVSSVLVDVSHVLKYLFWSDEQNLFDVVISVWLPLRVARSVSEGCG